MRTSRTRSDKASLALALFAAALACGASTGPGAALAGEAKTPGAVATTVRGAATARLSRTEGGAAIRLDIAEGWHVLSDRPGADYLVPLEVSGDCLSAVSYPPAESRWVAALGHDINVLKGSPEIGLAVKPGEAVSVAVTLQVCSDEMCLPPQKLMLAE